MFTCPENDIHSIYLDNELPENFKAEYEAHIADCPKCKAKLEQMRKTHQAFQYDSQAITLDREFLDQSFERLQSRMRYSKAIGSATEDKKERSVFKFPEPKKILPYAVAAALALAFIVPRVGGKINQFDQNSISGGILSPVAQIQPIKRTSDFSLDQSRIFAERSTDSYPLQLTSNSTYGSSNYTLISFSPRVDAIATPVQRSAKNSTQASNLLADDFFSPDFAQENNSELQVYMPAYIDISSLSE